MNETKKRDIWIPADLHRRLKLEATMRGIRLETLTKGFLADGLKRIEGRPEAAMIVDGQPAGAGWQR